MGILADFSTASATGFEQGQKMAGTNPLGNFIKMMLVEGQRKKVAQEEYGQKIGLINAEAEARSKYPSVLEKAIASQSSGGNIQGLGDMEIVGYDQKGNPMLRKIKRDVQGEKFDVEKEEKKKLQEEKREQLRQSSQEMLDTISEVEKGMNYFGIKGVMPAIPGTKQATWRANIDTLLSKKVLDKMRELKEQSKTGATGMGQLNLRELETMFNAATALKRTLPKKDAQKYLNDMKKPLQKIVSQTGSDGGDFSQMSDEELRRIANGE